ncbi:MAG: hypothetical protein ACRDDY_00700 [Clostridium sp.]|uniref:hypothetical protein n=1 Tax=Clostridium sp. TaxID=1506 RepID=UPI003EE76739
MWKLNVFKLVVGDALTDNITSDIRGYMSRYPIDRGEQFEEWSKTLFGLTLDELYTRLTNFEHVKPLDLTIVKAYRPTDLLLAHTNYSAAFVIELTGGIFAYAVDKFNVTPVTRQYNKADICGEEIPVSSDLRLYFSMFYRKHLTAEIVKHLTEISGLNIACDETLQCLQFNEQFAKDSNNLVMCINIRTVNFKRWYTAAGYDAAYVDCCDKFNASNLDIPISQVDGYHVLTPVGRDYVMRVLKKNFNTFVDGLTISSNVLVYNKLSMLMRIRTAEGNWVTIVMHTNTPMYKTYNEMRDALPDETTDCWSGTFVAAARVE